MGVLYEQVAAACDAMVAAGERPSVRKVRERLGNTGSASTLTQHLQAWRVKHQPGAVPVVIPLVLQRMLLELMEQERAAVRAALEEDLANLQQELADLAAENEGLEAQGVAHAARLAEQEGIIAGLHHQVALLTQERDETAAAACAERQAAEQARIELAKAQLRLESLPHLEQVLHQARADMERERDGRIVAEREVAVLATRLEAATAPPLYQALLSGERRGARPRR